MKVINGLVKLAILGIILTILLSINIDTFIYFVVGPILLIVVICIVYAICTSGGNGFTRQEDEDNFNYTLPSDVRCSRSEFKTSGNASWHSDKTYVPGAGYRDTSGNYYSATHVPIVTPVNTDNGK